jgi:probable 2-oxoglutarate dehydrogenase E1 component DHKTD1
MEVYFPSALNSLTTNDKLHLYRLLHDSETFDLFLQRRYRTLKRYSLEGCEVLVVALDRLFRDCATYDVKDVVLTMAHRGRLNTLVNLLQFPIVEMCYRLKGFSLIPLNRFLFPFVVIVSFSFLFAVSFLL